MATTHYHSIPQLQRLSYLLDKVQENTLAYQAEAIINNTLYLRMFTAATIIAAIKEMVGIIASAVLSTQIAAYILLGSSIIGVMLTVVNLISNANEYQAKKQQLSAAVEEFDILEDRLRFEMINPDQDFNKFCQQLEHDIEAIKSQCKYQPSLENKAKFRKESDRPGIDNTTSIKQNKNKVSRQTAYIIDMAIAQQQDIVNESTPLLSNGTIQHTNNKDAEHLDNIINIHGIQASDV